MCICSVSALDVFAFNLLLQQVLEKSIFGLCGDLNLYQTVFTLRFCLHPLCYQYCTLSVYSAPTSSHLHSALITPTIHPQHHYSQCEYGAVAGKAIPHQSKSQRLQHSTLQPARFHPPTSHANHSHHVPPSSHQSIDRPENSAPPICPHIRDLPPPSPPPPPPRRPTFSSSSPVLPRGLRSA